MAPTDLTPAQRARKAQMAARPLPTGVAGLVRGLRQDRGFSQAQLAKFAGLGLRTIRRAEEGGQLSVPKLKLLAAALGVEVAKLIASIVVLAAWGWAFGSALAGTL